MKLLKRFVILPLFLLLCCLPAQAQLETSEPGIDFGNVVRPKTKTVPLTVKNVSSTPFIGSAKFDKDWAKLESRDMALAPGESREIFLIFDTSSLRPGTYTGTLTFRDLMGIAKAQLSVTGKVIEGRNDPVLEISEKSLSFGDVDRGERPFKLVYFENIGSGRLKIELSYPQWMYGVEEFEISHTQVRPVQVVVDTRGMIPDEYRDEIKIKSNGGERSIPVSIKVKPAQDDPILSYSPDLLDFGTVRKGRRGRAKMKIKNIGKGSLRAVIVYPEYVVDGIEEVQDLTKDREVLVVIDTKDLPDGLTKDVIRVTSDHGIADIPFRIYVQGDKK